MSSVINTSDFLDFVSLIFVVSYLTFPFFCVADDVIKQSLHMVNDEFGTKSGENSPVLHSINKPSDCVTGGPLFDKTPARGLDDLADGSGGETVAPVYDRTPMQQGSDALHNPASSEHTPQWEDTPSQSEYGPVEVTQPGSMAEAQIEKYNREHGARVAQHEELVKSYRRKYPKRRKDANVEGLGPSVDHREDEDSAHKKCTKERVAVAKRKDACRPGKNDSPASITRRSPRFVACPSKSPSASGSASPMNTRRKRHVVFDETYVPDHDVAEGDDGAVGAEKVMILFSLFLYHVLFFHFLFVVRTV